MKILNIQTLIRNINQKNILLPIMLVGATGIGKSGCLKELIKDIQKENPEFGFIDLRLATMESTDLIGIPYNDNGRTKWAKPAWFPKENTKGILALEEINRSPEDVRQGIFQLLTEWKLHSHILPEGWSIVALINPDNGNYAVNQLDVAFRRRFLQLEVKTPSPIEWGIWGQKNNISQNMIAFVNQFPNVLNREQDTPDIQAINTPSGLEQLDKLYNSECIEKDDLLEVASGLIGREFAVAWLKSLNRKLETPIRGEEVLHDFKKISTQLKNQIKNKNYDLIYCTIIELLMLIDNKKLNTNHLTNLSLYLSEIPEEYCVMFLQYLIENHKYTLLLEDLSNSDNLTQKVKKLVKEIKEI